jgi:hypothetical protein
MMPILSFIKIRGLVQMMHDNFHFSIYKIRTETKKENMNRGTQICVTGNVAGDAGR